MFLHRRRIYLPHRLDRYFHRSTGFFSYSFWCADMMVTSSLYKILRSDEIHVNKATWYRVILFLLLRRPYLHYMCLLFASYMTRKIHPKQEDDISIILVYLFSFFCCNCQNTHVYVHVLVFVFISYPWSFDNEIGWINIEGRKKNFSLQMYLVGLEQYKLYSELSLDILFSRRLQMTTYSHLI